MAGALLLLVMEGGLSVKIKEATRVGLLSFAIALTGTVTPLALGFGFMSIINRSEGFIFFYFLAFAFNFNFSFIFARPTFIREFRLLIVILLFM